jgi:hypothetical protein
VGRSADRGTHTYPRRLTWSDEDLAAITLPVVVLIAFGGSGRPREVARREPHNCGTPGQPRPREPARWARRVIISMGADLARADLEDL